MDRDEDLRLLRLLQLFDSQFPVGAFAHSGGLETYAARGGALPELRQVLHAQIHLGWGRSELAAAWLAWQAADDPIDEPALARLGAMLDAVKVVPAIREMSLGLGRRTLDLLVRLHPGVLPPVPRPHHAIVVGVAGRRLGIGSRPLLLAFAQSLAAGTLAAAVRCMPIGAAQAQAVLIEVQPLLGTAVARAMADPEDSLFTCTPALDLRSHQQASLHTRLFQT
ncbi:MAG TPA: urease accessory UreF family protein [Vicinamibacterales bacterium]|nr:urease accessory UreF family protein [Vicinamibacterales bacterium]